MSIFPFHRDENLLPFGGTVNYFGKIFTTQDADHYFQILMKTIDWRNDEAFIFGKHIITARKVAWYADNTIPYTYSNITKTALPWSKELSELKLITERLTNSSFNSCLLNLYHNGSEGMAYHSDDEKSLARNGTIASLSFGAERKFLFKHKTNGHTVSMQLEHGSLLLMKDETQQNWMHRLPTTSKINSARINLTFRQMLI